MSDELKFVLQLALNLATISVAVWLAVSYLTRHLQNLLQAERQAAEETRRRMQAEILAGLPAIPPELEQLGETERWLLAARDLQLLLTSLGTLVRIRLRSDGTILGEIDRSLKFLERQEKKWLNPSLQIIAYARQLDPDRGNSHHQALEYCISRLTQAYVQAAQSLRRAASLCESDGLEAFSATLINTYVTEAERSTTDMAGGLASALDRLTYLKQNLSNHKAERIVEAVS